MVIKVRFILVFVVLSLFFNQAKSAGLRVGVSKVDITPSTGFPMWGYASRHDKPSKGVLDPLYARALVTKVGSKKLGIVSLDLGRPPTRDSFAVIQKQWGHPLLVVASHTHHGPVLEMARWPTPKEPYVKVLEQKILFALSQAEKSIQPARLGIVSHQSNKNRNRHSRKANPPVDREMLVARFEDVRGKTLAHLVNFAAHPTMCPRKLFKFSADYPGALCKYVEEKTNAPCLFLQGAGGDLSPNPGKAKGPIEFGELLGQEVLHLSKGIRCQESEAYNLKHRDRIFRFRSRIDHSNPFIKAAFSYAFFPEIVNFYEREYRQGVRPRITSVLLSDEIGLVGVSGEVFCAHAIRLKKRARLNFLFFLGYCNDYQQYFPTIEAIAEGGYGTEPEMSPAELGAGEKMMDQALIDLYQMRGKIINHSK